MTSTNTLMQQLLDRVHADVAPQHITRAVHAYLDSWTQADATSRADLFADEVIVEDPVGVPPLIGKAALIAFWEMAAGAPTRQTARLEKLVICGNEAFVEFCMTIDHAGVVLANIQIREIFKFDAAGKIVALRAFWNADCVS